MKNSSINKILIGFTTIVVFSVVGVVHGKDCVFDLNMELPTEHVIIGEKTYSDKNKPDNNGYWEYYWEEDKEPGPCQWTCKYGYEIGFSYKEINGKVRTQLICEKSSDSAGKRFILRKTALSSEDEKYVDVSEKKLKNNILTNTVWDKLMNELNNQIKKLYAIEDKLNNFKANFGDIILDIVSKDFPTEDYVIPEGAIMAFYGKKCPPKWEKFSRAENKILMGGADRLFLGLNGGSDSLKLTVDQLPQHHHYMFGPKSTQNTQSSDDYRIQNNDERFVSRASPNVVMLRMSSLQDEKDPTKYNNSDESLVRGGLTSSMLVNTEGTEITTQKSLYIMNPYIRVLYCIKTEN